MQAEQTSPKLQNLAKVCREEPENNQKENRVTTGLNSHQKCSRPRDKWTSLNCLRKEPVNPEFYHQQIQLSRNCDNVKTFPEK
jgi:hypothetical protein